MDKAQVPDTIAGRLQLIRHEVGRALGDSGRGPDDARLIAVSKIFPAEAVREALEAGQRRFGENYVQEAKAKWPALRADYPDAEIHLIGPLQSNKARDAVALFDVIHSLDRPSLAAALAGEARRGARMPRLLVQVNTGEEPQKSGVIPADLPAFLALCREPHGLTIHGLMCIPPAAEPPSPHFALLRELARVHGLAELSMGMSADFEQAIMLGATYVRVGTAIFGGR